MHTGKAEMSLEYGSNMMTPSEVLFGTVMAAACIYATWFATSLIIFMIS